MNGDGIDDILIGARGADPNGSNSGESYVVFGSASGFTASFDLSSLLAANGGDGTTGFVLNGIDSDGGGPGVVADISGFSVSAAGDVNGDGIDDILIGAPLAEPNGFASGESYVVFGSTTGFSTSFELRSLLAARGGDGSNGFVLNGIDENGQSGFSVSSAGDVNGDGIDDILIGARGADFSTSGESYVVFGSTAGFTASFELSSLLTANGGDGTTGFVLNGIDESDFSGHSVSGVGDVNGDGIDDILIGADGADPNGRFSGQSYIVFGSAAGFCGHRY